MSPSPSGSALRRDGAGPWCFTKRLRGQARQLVRSRNRSVYPLSGCGVYPYCRRTLVAERLGHGSAEIVDRGRRTTAASDTIRGASLQESVDCRQLIYRPREWAHFENSGSARQRAKPVRARPGPIEETERTRLDRNGEKTPARTDERSRRSDTQVDGKQKEKPNGQPCNRRATLNAGRWTPIVRTEPVEGQSSTKTWLGYCLSYHAGSPT